MNTKKYWKKTESNLTRNICYNSNSNPSALLDGMMYIEHRIA